MTNTVKNITVTGNGIVEISGKLYNTKWVTHKDSDTAIAYKHYFDVSSLTGDELIKLACNSLTITHHAFAKRKTESAAVQYLKDNEGQVIDVSTFTSGSGGSVGMFKECFGAIKGLRIAKFKDDKIVAALSEEYGEANVKAVLAGNNPWKAAPKESQPKVDKGGAVLTLDEIQKAEVLKIAKQIQEDMEELEVADRLMEVVRLCGYSEQLRPAIIKTANQIIK